MNEFKIVLVSGHWPLDVEFAVNTRKTLEHYCSLHNYDLYYDEVEPIEKEVHHLHYRRCDIMQRASLMFPDASWFVWLDTDIFVNRMDIKIESLIDLSDENILYHLFYENPTNDPRGWDFKYDVNDTHNVNTGVKFVSREGIKTELEIWGLRNDEVWKKFPYEQKVMIEKIIPENFDRIKIHNQYVLNCIEKFHPVQEGLFVHICGRKEEFRNQMMREVLKNGLNDTLLITSRRYVIIMIGDPRCLPQQF